MEDKGSPMLALFRQPLIRLLAINLAIGISAAVLMLGGLLLLNPGGLRDLIFADGSAGFIVLLFGFVVTFGSTAMGSAIMALGRQPPHVDGQGGKRRPEPVRIHGRAN